MITVNHTISFKDKENNSETIDDVDLDPEIGTIKRVSASVYVLTFTYIARINPGLTNYPSISIGISKSGYVSETINVLYRSTGLSYSVQLLKETKMGKIHIVIDPYWYDYPESYSYFWSKAGCDRDGATLAAKNMVKSILPGYMRDPVRGALGIKMEVSSIADPFDWVGLSEYNLGESLDKLRDYDDSGDKIDLVIGLTSRATFDRDGTCYHYQQIDGKRYCVLGVSRYMLSTFRNLQMLSRIMKITIRHEVAHTFGTYDHSDTDTTCCTMNDNSFFTLRDYFCIRCFNVLFENRTNINCFF